MTKTGWVWIGGLAALGLVAGGAWGLHRGGTAPAAQAAAASSFAASQGTAPASASPTYTAHPTTAFEVTSLEGSRITVPDGHPVVLYFMSAQCASCAQGEQQLSAFVHQLPAGVQIVSLDVTPTYDPASAVLAMAQEVGAAWPQAYATVPIMEAYDVTQLDQVAVVSGSGHIVYDGGLPSNATLLQAVHEAAAS